MFAMGQCRALILYVAAGALQDALAALRETQQPDTAAMFILACHEGHAQFISNLGNSDDESGSSIKDTLVGLPGLNPENEDVIAVVNIMDNTKESWCICAWTPSHFLTN
jgi:hypothetical protein